MGKFTPLYLENCYSAIYNTSILMQYCYLQTLRLLHLGFCLCCLLSLYKKDIGVHCSFTYAHYMPPEVKINGKWKYSNFGVISYLNLPVLHSWIILLQSTGWNSRLDFLRSWLWIAGNVQKTACCIAWQLPLPGHCLTDGSGNAARETLVAPGEHEGLSEKFSSFIIFLRSEQAPCCGQPVSLWPGCECFGELTPWGASMAKLPQAAALHLNWTQLEAKFSSCLIS